MTAKATSLLSKELTLLRVLTSAGVIRPYGPRVLLQVLQGLRHFGMGPAGGFTTRATAWPCSVATIAGSSRPRSR